MSFGQQQDAVAVGGPGGRPRDAHGLHVQSPLGARGHIEHGQPVLVVTLPEVGRLREPVVQVGDRGNESAIPRPARIGVLPCRAFHLRPGVGLEIDDHDPADAQLRIAVGGLAQVTASGLQLEDALLQEMIDRRLRVVDAHAIFLEITDLLSIGADETSTERQARGVRRPGESAL